MDRGHKIRTGALLKLGGIEEAEDPWHRELCGTEEERPNDRDGHHEIEVDLSAWFRHISLNEMSGWASEEMQNSGSIDLQHRDLIPITGIGR